VDAEVALAFMLLTALVAFVVLGPLRRPGEEEQRDEQLRADLEAAKESKYREINDAELDHRMGKLSRADWKKLDGELRAEAVEILRRLDELEGGEPPARR
jgi:hypothetical protein